MAAAGIGSALAGCNSAAQEGDPFDEVVVDGASLAVTLADGVRADEIALQSPDGSTFVRRQVDSGSEPSIPLVQTGYSSSPTQYDPGDNTLVVRRGGDRVGERTLSLVPDVEIVDLALPEESIFNPVVTVENVGTAPTLLTYLGFENVPHPTPSPEETNGLDSDASRLVPVSTRDFTSGSMPFAFRRVPSETDSLSCSGRTTVGVTVTTSHGDTANETFHVRFDGDVENILWLSHRCSDVTVEGTGD